MVVHAHQNEGRLTCNMNTPTRTKTQESCTGHGSEAADGVAGDEERGADYLDGEVPDLFVSRCNCWCASTREDDGWWWRIESLERSR